MNSADDPATSSPGGADDAVESATDVRAAGVYLPDGQGGPGRYGEAPLTVAAVGAAEVVVPEATVRDERGGVLFSAAQRAGGGLMCEPSAGGGPLAPAADWVQARAFGVVNTAFHVQRALRFVAALLGEPLPHLVVRIGLHDQPRRWGGGHYRLPGSGSGADPEARTPSGEVHLGGGSGFVRGPQTQRYFHAPAHNVAIICHEVGHHVCRHTADFRLNELRPAQGQTNKKTALDEGSADLLTAILLDTADIYGWHRHHVPQAEQRRRKLDSRWGMAAFQGGPNSDPHSDGTIWASACWSARNRIHRAEHHPTRFDRLFLHALRHAGRDAHARGLTDDTLRGQRHFSRLLTHMINIDPTVAHHLLSAMAEHDIHPGLSNHDLSQNARILRLVGA